MKRNFRTMMKRGWPLGVLLLSFALFLGVTGYRAQQASHAADYNIVDDEGIPVPTSGDYILRRATATFSLSDLAAGDTFKWSSLNPDILATDSATETSPTVSVSVKNTGTAGLECRITHADGSIETRTVSIQVVFSINESFGTSTVDGVKMTKIRETDERRSIVMDYGKTLYLGTSANTDPGKLNLIFGDATSGNADWTSNNSDVVRVNSSTHVISAAGVGRTKLTVTYRDGVNQYEDSIDVYVRPEIRRDGPAGERLDNSSQIFTMQDNDEIWIPALLESNPLEGILDKVTWVIAKRSGTTRTLVRDSLGNVGANGDDAELIYDSDTNTFRMDAKAGQYVVMFYVKGTYSTFEEAQDANIFLGCDPAYFNADVESKFADKDVTISIDGNYNLQDAFNISEKALSENFTFTAGDATGGAFNDIVSVDYDQWTLTGRQQGTVEFTVQCRNRPSETLPGVAQGQTVHVKVRVTDTFSLNVSNATMAVGSSLNLTGIIGSGVYMDTSTFRWDTSDSDGAYISLSSNAQYATVVAKKETPSDQPVIVRLFWTDENAVTRVAACRIYVTTSATNIPLDRTEIEMEVESVEYLDSGLRGEQNLTWISADTDMVKVEPQQGNTQAKLTAGKKTGTTVVTVLNKDNNVYATCRVTVTAAINEISIEQGENLDTVLSAGFVFLRAKYGPANATNTELKWTTSDPTVATVDENGVVTLLKEDTVWISVEPVFNPYNLVARCCINIRKNPVTDIITDVQEINMIAGDQYAVQTTIVPSDATDPTLLWNTDSDKIAKVEGGVITAVAPGDANITVSNGTVFKIIKVHVRNRLNKISFTQNEYEIKEGDTASLANAVIFDPKEHVNTTLAWTSSNSNVVQVDDEGNITGIKAGDIAMITCIPEDLGLAGAITCMIRVIGQDIPAKGVTLEPSEATMHVGEKLQIRAIFDPITATYQNLSWSSTDEEVATVDKNGLVTGVKEGAVSIAAVYRDPITGVVWDPIYCKITVEAPLVEAESFKLTPEHRELYVGDNYTVVPVFTPENTTNQKVAFYSSDETVAEIDEDGVVTGIAEGSAVLIGRAEDGNTVETCTVTVVKPPVPVEDFTVEPLEQEVQVGSTFYITPVFTPADASNQKVKYQTSDEAIATVDENGLVTGVALGQTTIVCQSVEGNIIATCKVTVIKPYVNVISFTITPIEQEVQTGSTFQITPVFTPEDATNQKVTYQSSDASVATVDEKGVVTGVAKGNTTVICQSDEGKIVVYCNVHVIEGVSLTLKPAAREIAVGKTFTITKVINPIEADPTATWESSDPAIATVTQNGKVKGIKKGSCVITCILTKYNVRATCDVTVATLKTTVSLNKTSIRMGTGTTYKLKAKIWSNNTRIPAVRWLTSKKRIASITQKGKIKAKRVGNTVITAVSRDRLKVKAKCKVRVIQRAKSIKIKPNYAICYVGGTRQLSVVMQPRSATVHSVTWKSEDTSIATVENNGMVRGIAEGETRIVATTKDGGKKKAYCVIKVTEKVPATSIVVAQSELTLKKGDSTELSYSVLPNNTSDDISFASDNKRVAKVSKSGIVSAVGTGNCTITIMSEGGVTSTVAVNVVALNRTSLTMRQFDTETLTVYGANNASDISWYSSNARVATVENGQVVGRSVGTTYIYATIKGCKMACKVTITKIE